MPHRRVVEVGALVAPGTVCGLWGQQLEKPTRCLLLKPPSEPGPVAAGKYQGHIYSGAQAPACSIDCAEVAHGAAAGGKRGLRLQWEGAARI